jgi:hypothetical protein
MNVKHQQVPWGPLCGLLSCNSTTSSSSSSHHAWRTQRLLQGAASNLQDCGTHQLELARDLLAQHMTAAPWPAALATRGRLVVPGWVRMWVPHLVQAPPGCSPVTAATPCCQRCRSCCPCIPGYSARQHDHPYPSDDVYTWAEGTYTCPAV